MRRTAVLALVVVGMTACAQVPRERGVGFDDYSQYELERARREAALSTSRVNPPVVPPSTGTLPTPQRSGGLILRDELAAAGIGQNTASPSVSSGPAPGPVGQPLGRVIGLEASPTNAAPALAGGISDEQSFDAVSGRETIESDAQRRAQQAAARQQVAPTAVPDRPSDTGPNIVEYAINAPNVKGQEWYSRFVFASEARFQRNCASYASADDAQRDFLARGGPERDRRGIDPDGDGFACGWDPAPFKQARN